MAIFVIFAFFLCVPIMLLTGQCTDGYQVIICLFITLIDFLFIGGSILVDSKKEEIKAKNQVKNTDSQTNNYKINIGTIESYDIPNVSYTSEELNEWEDFWGPIK